jgi:hypothetical protein
MGGIDQYSRGEQAAAKPGGHGDHWGCILRNVEEAALLDLIRNVLSEDRQSEVFDVRRNGVAARSQGDSLRVCVLLEDHRLVSAYPEAQGGAIWPVTVKEIVPWSNGLEGQVVGDCFGADARFFDTRFYANRDKYKRGETYNFHVNAFAYTIGPAPDAEVDTGMGAKVSLKGARAYMPADVSNTEADIDDFWFHSPIEGQMTTAELGGTPKRLRVFPIVMAIPEDFEMSVNLYAAEHVMTPGTDALKAEHDLEGFLWLQGYLSNS